MEPFLNLTALLLLLISFLEAPLFTGCCLLFENAASLIAKIRQAPTQEEIEIAKKN